MPVALNTEGLEIADATLHKLFDVPVTACLNELDATRAFFETFGDRTPGALYRQLDLLQKRLSVL
jgi:GTP-dependent phosphoenolpyruvate carboxykinase